MPRRKAFRGGKGRGKLRTRQVLMLEGRCAHIVLGQLVGGDCGNRRIFLGCVHFGQDILRECFLDPDEVVSLVVEEGLLQRGRPYW